MPFPPGEGTGPIEQSDRSQQLINHFQDRFAHVRPDIRRVLKLQENDPDTFFVGLYGSTVKGEANQDSDIDGQLFYIRQPNSPKDRNLGYKLIHGESEDRRIFQSPAQSLFGHETGTIPPNPDGKEDIEPHDITSLVNEIENNQQLGDTRIKELAIIFSPIFVGEETFVTQLRQKILIAMKNRTGAAFDIKQLHGKRAGWDYLLSEIPQFALGRVPGNETWQQVQQEYLILFKRPLFDLPQE